MGAILFVGWILDDSRFGDAVDKRSPWRGPSICGLRDCNLLRLLLVASKHEITEVYGRNQEAIGSGLLRANGVILLGRGEP